MINRRTFLQTTAAASLLTVTALPVVAQSDQLDLWEAQIDTILQMATDYQFNEAQSKGLFGWYPFTPWPMTELRSKMLEPFARGSRDMQDRVENILTVHTWLRAKCGSYVQTQLYELDKPRVDFYVPDRITGGTLGALLRSGDYFKIRRAAEWCQTHSDLHIA